MRRMVRSIDDCIRLTGIREFFPIPATVETLRRCDVIVACVDRLHVRDDLNRFCKRYLIPMVDVGIEITPDPQDTGVIQAGPVILRRARSQAVTPWAWPTG
jgi:hypothetical protein